MVSLLFAGWEGYRATGRSVVLCRARSCVAEAVRLRHIIRWPEAFGVSCAVCGTALWSLR